MERRLPGERPELSDIEDAEHWVRVYGELQGFIRNLIETDANRSPSGAAEVTIALRTRLTWIERRLQYWEERRRALR